MTKRTLTIRLEPDDATALNLLATQFASAWNSKTYQGEFLSYATAEQLFRVISPARWGVLQALQRETAPIGLRPLARKLQRDPSAVLRDLTLLESEGIIQQTESGSWLSPFSEIRTEFSLAHAA